MSNTSNQLIKCKSKGKIIHLGLKCPECFREDGKHKLHTFKTSKGLARHLHEHSISDEQHRRIIALAKSFESNSFIILCFETGVLF